jgi:hypothetical protein
MVLVCHGDANGTKIHKNFVPLKRPTFKGPAWQKEKSGLLWKI